MFGSCSILRRLRHGSYGTAATERAPTSECAPARTGTVLQLGDVLWHVLQLENVLRHVLQLAITLRQVNVLQHMLQLENMLMHSVIWSN